MKIFIVQYQDSMSPTGEIAAVSLTLSKVKQQAQEYEDGHQKDPEQLKWTQYHGKDSVPYLADGFGGEYQISTWEVSLP